MESIFPGTFEPSLYDLRVHNKWQPNETYEPPPQFKYDHHPELPRRNHSHSSSTTTCPPPRITKAQPLFRSLHHPVASTRMHYLNSTHFAASLPAPIIHAHNRPPNDLLLELRSGHYQVQGRRQGGAPENFSRAHSPGGTYGGP